jgi:hypothetical protein
VNLKFHADAASAVALLLLATLAAVSAWVYATRYPVLPRRRAAILLGLRALALVSLALAALAPVLRYATASKARNRLLVLVDHSGSMDVRDVDGGARSRREAADSVALALERELQGRFDVRIAPFDAALSPFGRGRDALGQAAARGGRGETALGDAIRGALARTDPDSVAALVVVSDGAVNRGEDPERAIGGTLPAFGFVVGSAQNPPTAGIAGIEAPAEVVMGRPATLTVTAAQGVRPAARTVARVRELGRELARADVALAGPDASTRVGIPFTLEGRGKHFLEISLDPIAGDSMRENKRRLIAVSARPPKQSFPIIAGAWDWDLRSVGRGVEEDSAWAVLRASPAGPASVERAGGGPPVDLGRLLETADAAAVRYDAATLTPPRAAAILRFLERGGGVLFIVDPQGSTPAESPLTRSLGLDWRSWNRSSAVFGTVELAPQGRFHELALLGGDAATAGSVWRALPPVQVPLAMGLSRGGSLERLLQARIENDLVPLLAAGQVGLGRVAVLDAAGFYRWGLTAAGLGGGPSAESPFMGSVRRWLAGSGEDRPVRITAADLTPEGRPVSVRLALGAAWKTGGPIRAAVAARRIDRPTPPKGWALAPTAQGDFAGAIRLDAGIYSLVGRVERGGRVIGFDSTRVAVGSEGVEYESLRAEPDVLARLASGSGGVSATIANPGPALARLRAPDVARARVVELDLFHNPALFAIILVFIAAEWIVRRRFHLL